MIKVVCVVVMMMCVHAHISLVVSLGVVCEGSARCFCLPDHLFDVFVVVVVVVRGIMRCFCSHPQICPFFIFRKDFMIQGGDPTNTGRVRFYLFCFVLLSFCLCFLFVLLLFVDLVCSCWGLVFRLIDCLSERVSVE